jgi:hypothetical protein
MKRSLSTVTMITSILVAAALLSAAQNKASIQVAKSGPFRPGEPITFNLKLNAPMPKGAYFSLRIAPVSTDDEVNLGSGQPINASQTEFRVTGKVPESALPGEWHIAEIYLFLPGVSWTHSTIAPSGDVKFDIEGKPYPIPTKADVTIGH